MTVVTGDQLIRACFKASVNFRIDDKMETQ